jgi:hypothetical protein
MNANTLEEAASYRGYWPIEDMGELLNYMGRWYYNALLLPERNNQGLLPIEQLRKDSRYPRMFRMGSLAKIPTGSRTPRYGWITSSGTKPKMVHEFIKALRDGTLLLHDRRFLEEAATFIRTDKGGFAASGSNFDDHVMSHLGAYQGVMEVGQYPVIYEDRTIKPVTWGDVLSWDEELDAPIDPMSVPIGNRPRQPANKSWIITR